MKKLAQTKQCNTCPWRVGTTCSQIPNYQIEKHKELINTISEGGFNLGAQLPVMSCHYSGEGEESYCVGWLWNQLGPGNNIALRLQMREYENAADIEVVGEQVEHFNDTFK